MRAYSIQEQCNIARQHSNGYLGPRRYFRWLEVGITGNFSGRKKGESIIFCGLVALTHLLEELFACLSLRFAGWPACYKGKEKVHSGGVVPCFGHQSFRKFSGHFHALGFIEQAK